MSVTVSENYKFTIDDKSATLYMDAWGTEDPTTVILAVEAAVPDDLGGFPLENIRYEHVGGGVWTAEGSYKAAEQTNDADRDDVSFDLDIGGASTHITQSIQTRNTYAATGYTAPNYQRAIGVTRDSVEGCDIEVATFGFSIGKSYDPGTIDWAFIRNLFRKCKTVNSDSVSIATDDGFTMEFDPGELRFDSVSISKKTADKWRFKFHFTASPNVTGLSTGGITIAAKRGWDYVWFAYIDDADGGTNTIIKRPIAAYVEQVYRESTLNGLV